MYIDTNGLIAALSEFTAITKQVVPDNCKENLLNAIALLSSAIENSSDAPNTVELSLQECSTMITASVDITVKSSKKASSKTSLSLSEWISIAAFILNLIQTLISSFPAEKPDPQLDVLIHQQQVIINHLEKRYDQESETEEDLSKEFFDFREHSTEFNEKIIEFTEDFRNLSERIVEALDLVGDASHNGDDSINVIDDGIDDGMHPKCVNDEPDVQKQDADTQ